MSKKALCFLLTIIITTSILFCSLVTAYGEEVPDVDLPEMYPEGFTEDVSEEESIPEATDLPLSKAQFPVLTVNAISNYFGKAYAEYNEFTREVTVSYLLKASKRLLTTNWVLTYDSSVLKFDPEKNPMESVCSVMKNSSVMRYEETDKNGKIVFNATSLKLFDFTNRESVFARIVFDVAELTENDSEITKVDLTVNDLWVSEPNPENGQSLENKEIILISNSKVIETDKTDSVLVSKITSLTKPTFVEPDLSHSTADQVVTAAPATQASTTSAVTAVPASAPMVKKAVKKTSNALVRTGEWYIAFLILIVLFICSTILFVMRKRDIYNI